MEELRDLQQIYSTATNNFAKYEGSDFVLPQVFKNQVKELNSSSITYYRYSAVIETRGGQNGGLKIYLPNQWFYVASYFTDLYIELQKYKNWALKVVSKERLKELNGQSLTEDEQAKINALSLDDTSKQYLVKFITDYRWWNGAKTIDRGDFYVSPILSCACLVNASQSFVADLCAFLADRPELVRAIISNEGSVDSDQYLATSLKPLQKIFFGAPGTGKSHEVKRLTGELLDSGEKVNLPNVFRTTFHPDTDYASFVGCYKPTMKPTSKEEKTLTGKDEEIVYEYVPQVFADAYVYAYSHPTEKTYLVIEEINRGNCAQIFGDLFQLLDRKNGVSEYTIKADKDLAKHLVDVLGEDSAGIKDGKLCLPDNLHILATMNTSDQSLFPMDSAFKRRWEWEYVPINYGDDIPSGSFEITIDDKTYPWVAFIQKVNEKIFDLTQSEDKQMGNFFIKNSIGEDEFKSKVMFYLWYEVLRDETGNNKYFFNTVEGKPFTFKDLYAANAKETIKQFMEYLGVPAK